MAGTLPGEQKKKFRLGGDFLVISSLVVIFSFLFFYANVKDAFPRGSAGFYSLMAETIAGAHFALPTTIPFYGPGGIPFAYPPLAFYLMAFFTDLLKVAPFVYLRFAPPLFLTASLVPLFLLARQITGTTRQAALATIFFGTSLGIISYHNDAGGVSRGLALLSMLWGMYFSYRSFAAPKTRTVVLAVVFLGLTILSDLSYAGFALAWLVVAGIFATGQSTLKRIGLLVSMILGMLLVSMPWWLTVVARDGFDIFLNVLNTHGNAAGFLALVDPIKYLNLFWSTFLSGNESLLLVGAASLGLFVSLARGKYFLPLLLLLAVFITGLEGERFVAIVSAFLGAVAVEEFFPHKPAVLQLELRGALGFIADLTIVFVAIRSAFLLRLGGALADYLTQYYAMLAVSFLVKPLTFYLFGLYPKWHGVTSRLNRTLLNLLAITLASAVVALLLFVFYWVGLYSTRVPISVLIADWLLCVAVIGSFHWILDRLKPDRLNLLPSVVVFVLFVIFSLQQANLFNVKASPSPEVFTRASDLAGWLKAHEPPGAVFLLVSDRQDELEWFPYLLRRTPAVNPVGAEWIGQYASQTDLINDLVDCYNRQSLACLESTLTDHQIHPDLLITYTDPSPYSISTSLQTDAGWVELYANDRYTVWGERSGRSAVP
jgi:hypothetical protein